MKFEIKCIQSNNHEFNGELNKLVEQGWELVSVTSVVFQFHEGRYTAYLKREAAPLKAAPKIPEEVIDLAAPAQPPFMAEQAEAPVEPLPKSRKKKVE